MADEQHGIEIEIDSRPAEAGKDRVVRSLDEIKKKTEQVGKAGEAAGKQTSDGLGRSSAGAAKAGRSMDEIRAKAREAGNSGKRAGESISDGMRRAATGIDASVAAAARLQPTLAQIEATSNRVGRAAPFKGFQGSARNLLGDLINLKNALIGIGLYAIGKEVASTAAQFRGFDQSLKIIAGSQAGANAEMQFATDVATRLGFRVADITKAYIGFAAASKGTSLEGTRQREVFESVTKAGVAYGLSSEQVSGALLAVQQMMSKGTVQAEELRGQLGERLPGAFQVAARAMGVTTAELGKMLEAGSVVSADFLPKFAAQLNKEIPNGVKNAAGGFNAFLSQLDRAKVVLAESGLFDGMTAGAKGLADALQGLASNGSLTAIGSSIGGLLTFLGQNISLLKDAAIAYGVYFAAMKTGAIVAFISQLVALEFALGATTTASALASVGIKGVQAAMALLLSPIALVTAGITGLVLAFMSISSAGSATQTLLDGVGKQALGASKSLEAATDRAIAGASGIASVGTESNGAVAGIDNFAGAVGRAAQQLYELAKARQQAALSSLIKQRNEAATTFNQLRAQSNTGLAERSNQARETASKGSGLGRIGNIFRGVGQAIGVARDTAAKATGFGPDETALRQGAATARTSVTLLDEAIKRTQGSLEQFVTAQDKAGASSAKVAKPNMTLNNALAKEAGAVTDLQKATAHLGVVRAQGAAAVKAGTMSEADYRASVADATQQVNGLREAHKGSTKALAEHNKMLAEGTKNANTRGNISQRYNEQPRYLDTLDDDQKALDDMVGKWIEVGDAVVRYTQAMHDADTATLNLAKRKPFAEMLDDMDRQVNTQGLILQGRNEEAKAAEIAYDYQKRFGAMQPGQYEMILSRVQAQEMMNRLLEDQQRLVGMYAQTVDDVRESFDKMLNTFANNPLKAVGGFVKGLGSSLKNLMTRSISESVFGGLDREIEDFVTGRSGVQTAVDTLKTNTDSAGAAAGTLAETLTDAVTLVKNAMGSGSSPLGSTSGSGSLLDALSPANDNTTLPNGDIVIEAPKKTAAEESKKTVMDPGATAVFNKVIERVVGRASGGLSKVYNALPPGAQNFLKGVGTKIEGGLNKLGIKLPKGIEGISGAVTKGLKGAGQGMMASSLVGQLGLKQSKTGAAIGGAAGSFLPIPGGAIIGGIVGGTIGGLFKKSKQASASVNIENGQVVGGAGTGKGSAEKAAASALSNSVASGINSVAQSLGGQIGGMTTGLSIGYRPGHKAGAYRVDPTGKGQLKGGSVMAFETEAEAIAAAIKIAVKNGVITGISEASKRVLASSNNTDAAVAAASTYEDLLRQAAKIKDPIKGAFDEIKRGMDNTLAQLKAAGYSQADLAAVQSVFDQQQKDTLKGLTSGYQDFIKSITTGQNSGKTIYGQFQDAQVTFAEARSGVANGTKTQEDFTSAGQTLMDLTRQVYGSATPEFEAVKAELVSASNTALEQVQKAASTASGNTQAVVDAVNAQAAASAAQRDETNRYLAQIAEALRAAGTAGYVGGGGTAAAARQAY